MVCSKAFAGRFEQWARHSEIEVTIMIESEGQ